MRVQKFTREGEYLSIAAVFGGSFASALAFSPAGILYANDEWRYRIRRFAPDGQELEPWDYSAAQFGLAIDPDGNLLLSGREVLAREPFLVFGPWQLWRIAEDGQVLQTWPSHGAEAIASDPAGNVYGLKRIPNEAATFVLKFTDGLLVREWDVNPSPLRIRMAADGIAIGGGHVYVACRPNGEGYVYKFSHRGRYLARWRDSDENHEPMRWPTGIAVDEDLNIYVGDLIHNRVLKYGYGDP